MFRWATCHHDRGKAIQRESKLNNENPQTEVYRITVPENYDQRQLLTTN